MKTTLTEFQRAFRQAREAADRGEQVLVQGESGDYIFERRPTATGNPFTGMEGVFGAVKLQDQAPLREKIRRRLAAKHRHRGRRAA